MVVRKTVEDEIAPAAEDLGIGLVTWSPLRSGLLSGKHNDGVPKGTRLELKDYQWLRGILNESDLEKARRLSGLASETGISLPQLAIAWLPRLPQVSSVISGATRVSQVQENLGAVEVLSRLTPEVLERIESILGAKTEIRE